MIHVWQITAQSFSPSRLTQLCPFYRYNQPALFSWDHCSGDTEIWFTSLRKWPLSCQWLSVAGSLGRQYKLFYLESLSTMPQWSRRDENEPGSDLSCNLLMKKNNWLVCSCGVFNSHIQKCSTLAKLPKPERQTAPLIWKVQAVWSCFLKEKNLNSPFSRLAKSLLLSVCIALEFIPNKPVSLQCVAPSCQKPFLQLVNLINSVCLLKVIKHHWNSGLRQLMH